MSEIKQKLNYKLSLEYKHPEITKQWHPIKNGNLKPIEIIATSGLVAYWLCENGHSWKTSINNRTVRGDGCRECRKIRKEKEREERKKQFDKEKINSRITIITDKNSFVKNYPKLLKEWDWEKNNKLGIDPYKLTKCNTEYAHWKGKCGHEWKTSIIVRTGGSGCPYCNTGGNIDKDNYIDIRYPDALEYWDKEKNNEEGITYRTYKAHSNNFVNCKCPKCGYKWKSRLINLTKKNRICKCNHELLTKDKYEKLLEEWDYDKNEKQPEEFEINSYHNAHWSCINCGENWIAKISERVKGGKKCPNCTDTGLSSNIERIFYYYLKKTFGKKTKNNMLFKLKDGKKKRFDITISSLDPILFIEYDGFWFHKDKIKKDKTINELVKEKKLNLIRIREKDLISIDRNNEVRYSGCKSSKDIKKTFFDIISIIESKYKLEEKVKKRIKKFEKNDFNLSDIPKDFFFYPLRENSLEKMYPKIAKEWHEELNHPLTPAQVSTTNAEINMFWKCKCGFVFEKKIAYRVNAFKNKTKDCPKCKFFEKNKNIIKKWDSKLNNGLKIENVVNESKTKKYNWSLDCGHVFCGTFEKRRNLITCQTCKQESKLIYKKAPELNNFFLEKENNTIFKKLNHSQFKKGYWWTCDKCGIRHFCSIENKIKNDYFCTGCHVNFNENRFNFLKTEYLEEKNTYTSDVLYKYSVASAQKFWWVCSKCGHVWLARYRTRFNGKHDFGKNCPHCNSFGNKNPELLKFWDYELNKDIDPMNMSPWSAVYVHLNCDVCGHKFKRSLAGLTSFGFNCPKCIEKKVTEKQYNCTECDKAFYNKLNRYNGICKKCFIEKNSIEKKFPELLKNWDYVNNEIAPNLFYVYDKFEYEKGEDKKLNHNKIWLKCDGCGKERKITLHRFFKDLKLCPDCYKQMLKKHNFQTYSKKTFEINKYFKSKNLSLFFEILTT